MQQTGTKLIAAVVRAASNPDRVQAHHDVSVIQQAGPAGEPRREGHRRKAIVRLLNARPTARSRTIARGARPLIALYV